MAAAPQRETQPSYNKALVAEVDMIAAGLERALGIAELPRRLHGKIHVMRASSELRAWLLEVIAACEFRDEGTE